jgi:hypothetical protein
MLLYHGAMPRDELEPELAGSRAGDVHPSPADLERFVRGELEDAELQVVVRHLLTRCEKCRGITARLWSPGSRQPISLIQMLAEPEVRLAARRRPGRPKKWDPRMSAAVASLESVAQELLREYAKELESLGDRLEILTVGLSRVPSEDPARGSVAEQLEAAIACVLRDTLRPAIEDLRAAAGLAAEPKEEESETA